MSIIFLGTSNCITHGSFVSHVATQSKEIVKNYSVGASSSAVGSYFGNQIEIQSGDIVVLDYVINDSGYIWKKIRSATDIKANLASVVRIIRNAGGVPLLLIVPSQAGFKSATPAEVVHVEFCERYHIQYINLAEWFRRLSLSKDVKGLMRDPSHMSCDITPIVAQLILTTIEVMRCAEQRNFVQPATWYESRTLRMEQLVSAEELVKRSSSLYDANFGVLKLGQNLNLKTTEGEQLAGIMLNTGAYGGHIQVQSEYGTATKPLTVYWDIEKPDWFTAIMVDFLHPVRSSSSGIDIKIVDQNATLTEDTLHSQPVIPGRYGCLEVEGFLIITLVRNEDWSYSAPLTTALDVISFIAIEQFESQVLTVAAQS